MSLTTVDSGLLSSNAQQVGMKNRIFDGGFVVNQRTYVSGTALGVSMAYGHDRWKGGSGGGTYAFTQGALGVNTTITITAGTIMQVIEGCNLPEGGTYVLSWTGTAQGRLNGGTYGASGTVTVTGWVAGTNLNVEFNTGTLGSVQLEKGSTATSFDYRPYGTELQLCQRYYWRSTTGQAFARYGIGVATSTTLCRVCLTVPVQLRALPSAIEYGGALGLFNGGSIVSVTSVTFDVSQTLIQSLSFNTASGLTSASAYQAISNNDSNAYVGLTAEL